MGVFKRIKNFFTKAKTPTMAEQRLAKYGRQAKETPSARSRTDVRPTLTDKLFEIAEQQPDAVQALPVDRYSPANDFEAFLYFQQTEFVESSNVLSVQYHFADQVLLVMYRDGSQYQYAPVTVEMAEDFITAPSKGKWVWDNLRVRGTVFGFQVPYRLVVYGGMPARQSGPQANPLVVGKANERPARGRRTGGFVHEEDIVIPQSTRDKWKRENKPRKPKPPI